MNRIALSNNGTSLSSSAQRTRAHVHALNHTRGQALSHALTHGPDLTVTFFNPPNPPTVIGRDNVLGLAGWEAVMEGLEGCSRLACLDGIACAGLVAGGLAALSMEGRGDEAGLALAVARRFLPRSTSSLVTLDLRCAALRAVP